MRHRIRSHLTYANVMATLAVFLVLGGGTALASYVISSNSQVGPNTISGHHVSGTTHPNLIAGSVGSKDVADNTLTGADIADRSGVDTCSTPPVKKFGPICAGSDGNQRTWNAAMNYCAASRLRLPSLSEAITLAKGFDVPGIGATGVFWTNDSSLDPQTLNEYAYVVDEDGNYAVSTKNVTNYTVCVTDPSA
jgi:hypothetical protein